MKNRILVGVCLAAALATATACSDSPVSPTPRHADISPTWIGADHSRTAASTFDVRMVLAQGPGEG
jgi:hypothetical protein